MVGERRETDLARTHAVEYRHPKDGPLLLSKILATDQRIPACKPAKRKQVMTVEQIRDVLGVLELSSRSSSAS